MHICRDDISHTWACGLITYEALNLQANLESQAVIWSAHRHHIHTCVCVCTCTYVHISATVRWHQWSVWNDGKVPITPVLGLFFQGDKGVASGKLESSRGFLHDLWPLIFCYFFLSAEMIPKGPRNHPKGYPLERFWGRLGGKGRNVKQMVSPSMTFNFAGGPQRPRLPDLVHGVFQGASRNDFFSFCPREDTGRTQEPLFVLLFPPCLPFGAPGVPRVSKTPHKTTKMIPKSTQNAPRGSTNASQRPINELIAQGLNLSIGRSIQARWRPADALGETTD